MAAIPDGMRAVGVKVNDVIGVAGFVVPGSRVDVVLSGSPNKNNELEMSKVILENVQVLAAGQNVTSDANGKPQNVQVVTLLVTPDQSQTLALAQVDGRIQLALRNPLDLHETNPNAVRRENLFSGGKSVALVAPPASAPAPVKRAAKPASAPAPVVAAPVIETPKPAAPLMTTKTIQTISGSKIDKVVFETKEPKEEAPVQP